MAGAASTRCLPLLLGAVVFASLPSCITSGLWRDSRTRQRLDEVRIHTPVVVDPTQPQFSLVLDAAKTGLVPALLAPGTTSQWVRLEPIAHAESVRAVLTAGDRRQGVVVQYFAEPAPGLDRVELYLWLGLAGRWDALSGVRHRWGLKAWTAELVVPCRVVNAARPAPEWPVLASDRFRVCSLEVRDDDYSTVAKVLLTPVTVLTDVLLLPFELLTISLWW